MKLPGAAFFLIFACAAAFAGPDPLGEANSRTGTAEVNTHTLLITGNQISARGPVPPATLTVLGRIGAIGDVIAANAYAAILEGSGIAGGGPSTLANSLTLQPSSIIELALSTSGEHSSFARSGSTRSFELDLRFAFVGSWSWKPRRAVGNFSWAGI